MKKSSIFHALSCALFSLSKTAFPFQHPEGKFKRHFAFSLVEMLMALLVASLLLAALAPVMTKRMNENIHITGEFSHNGRSVTEEIIFGGPYCNRITNDEGGNPLYCEGEYTVPQGFNNITAVAIGGGGGGGAAPNAGYMEFTTAGSTSEFKVPLMTNKIEATLISGGAGGGAGGQVLKTHTFVTSGNGGVTQDSDNKLTVLSGATGTWTVPEITRGKNVLVTGCGGGGGGGGSWYDSARDAGGGGSGAYVTNTMVTFGAQNSVNIFIGGGGGGGGGDDSGQAGKGRAYGGGGGGHEAGEAARVSGSFPGGDGGYSAMNSKTGQLFPIGGSGDRGVGGNGSIADNIWAGGMGSVGGNGGGGGAINNWLTNIINSNGSTAGGGGGGSEGGGGGGAGNTGCGGGGGGATIIKQGAEELFNIGGGGGGGGVGVFPEFDTDSTMGAAWNGGGGGGGNHGGNGGSGYITPGGFGGKVGGANASAYYYGGKISTVWGSNYCAGGNSGTKDSWATMNGQDGNDGALTVSYLDYGPGGSGGGSGQMVPVQPVSVNPNEILNVSIGIGAQGGKAGKIETTGIVGPTNGSGGNDGSEFYLIPTVLKRGSDTLLSTITNNNVQGVGAWGGCPTGEAYGPWIAPHCGCQGYITDGVTYRWLNDIYGPFNFITENGHTAGNGTTLGAAKYNNGTIGGDGGKLITPWFTCTPGKGGTLSKPKGGDGAGYGCGGGGGYGLSDGGRGSGGYARISWNMYWDTAANVYKSYTLGAGGGGASGNVIKETIRVQEGQVIKIRIGAGGIGAKVVNGEIIPATPGGTTIFGDTNFIEIKAGGGGGGMSPVVKDGILTKGEGGKPSNICSVGSRNYINNNKYCTKGTTGEVAADDGTNAQIGGLGAPFSYTFNKKTYTGQGGGGGMQATEENNSKGKNAEGVASGGGGAALLTQNYVQNQSQLIYPQGGNGAHGRIILQLWE